MDNMMKSVGKYIQGRYAQFGLGAVEDFRTIAVPKAQLLNGAVLLIMLELQTLPDTTYRVPFGNLIASGIEAERFLTQMEFECKTRNPDPTKDFFWNPATKLRDKVYKELAGTYAGGILIPRYDYSDPENPVQDGEIWFEVDPQRGYPQEHPVEDPNDPNNKSKFLTYNVHWWRKLATV